MVSSIKSIAFRTLGLQHWSLEIKKYNKKIHSIQCRVELFKHNFAQEKLLIAWKLSWLTKELCFLTKNYNEQFWISKRLFLAWVHACHRYTEVWSNWRESNVKSNALYYITLQVLIQYIVLDSLMQFTFISLLSLSVWLMLTTYTYTQCKSTIQLEFHVNPIDSFIEHQHQCQHQCQHQH